jgi:hypothetical protein
MGDYTKDLKNFCGKMDVHLTGITRVFPIYPPGSPSHVLRVFNTGAKNAGAGCQMRKPTGSKERVTANLQKFSVFWQSFS